MIISRRAPSTKTRLARREKRSVFDPYNQCLQEDTEPSASRRPTDPWDLWDQWDQPQPSTQGFFAAALLAAGAGVVAADGVAGAAAGGAATTGAGAPPEPPGGLLMPGRS